MPQRAYVPHGTLRQALQYPFADTGVPDTVLMAALEGCGLTHLSARPDERDRWDKQLSGGEQQRIGFARLVIQRPNVVIMDEATAALEVASQASMMELFHGELAGTTVISVGRRPELEAYHTRKLALHRHAAEVDLSEVEVERRHILGRLLRRTLRPRATPDPSHPVSS